MLVDTETFALSTPVFVGSAPTASSTYQMLVVHGRQATDEEGYWTYNLITPAANGYMPMVVSGGENAASYEGTDYPIIGFIPKSDASSLSQLAVWCFTGQNDWSEPVTSTEVTLAILIIMW